MKSILAFSLLLFFGALALPGCAIMHHLRPCESLTYSYCPDRCFKRCVGSCEHCDDCDGQGSCVHFDRAAEAPGSSAALTCQSQSPN